MTFDIKKIERIENTESADEHWEMFMTTTEVSELTDDDILFKDTVEKVKRLGWEIVYE